MIQTARKPSPEPCLEYGTVEGRQGLEWSVRTDRGRYAAGRAKSCLLAPEPGDGVLVCTDEMGRCFILAVLEGAREAGVIEHEGDLSLRVHRGDLSLTAEHGMRLSADTCSLAAREGSATLGALSWLAESVHGRCRTLALTAERCTQTLRSLTQRLGSLFRRTEDHEEVQAASRRELVEGTHTLHCTNSVTLAEENVRVDADQIQLG